MPRKSTAPSRKLLGEKGVSKELLGNFDPKKSRGMIFLRKIFHDQITVNRLISLATIFSKILDIELPRNYKRNKELLTLWFDMHLDQIEGFSDNIIIERENGKESIQIQNENSSHNES